MTEFTDTIQSELNSYIVNLRAAKNKLQAVGYFNTNDSTSLLIGMDTLLLEIENPLFIRTITLDIIVRVSDQVRNLLNEQKRYVYKTKHSN